MTADTGTGPQLIDLVAGPGTDGQRIDRFIAESLGTLSRSRVKSLILQGLASRDGHPVREPADSVQEGARYRLTIPAPLPAVPTAEDIPLAILYEDADLIVLDKPAGLVVHPAPGNQEGTLVNALLAYCGDTLPGIGGEKRPGIVHRLDKDTSGVMVVAKTEQALATLSAAFAARDLERAYLALCWGLPAQAEGEVAGTIGRDPRDRKRMAVVTRGGKTALTRYRTLRHWMTAVSLLECRLATGRTHQIRVHMADIGHPIVGDPVYLRRTPAVAKLLAAPTRDVLLDFPRQALHAGLLAFRHPRTGEPMRFETPMPLDMDALIHQLDDTAQAMVTSR